MEVAVTRNLIKNPKSMSEALHIDPEDLDMWYHGNVTIVNIFNEKTDIFSATAVSPKKYDIITSTNLSTNRKRFLISIHTK